MVTVANFDVQFTQILNEKGNISSSLPSFAKSSETLIELYQTMLLTRLFDKKAIALQRTGKMGTYAPVNGQEAIATAIGHALKKDDVFIPYYRDYAAQFQRKVKPSEILAYWGGDERGNNYKSSHDLSICVPIASQCLHAAGIAFALKYKNTQHVALVTIGDGGTSEGDFYEAINVAGAWQLPLIFVINNNQWAISVPLNKQTACQTLAQKAFAAGFSGEQVDGNDVIALRHVIGNAIENARNGQGPHLIEALSYRLSDHTTADDATRYQPSDDVKLAEPKEPISRLKKYLEKNNILTTSLEKEIQRNCEQQINAAVDEFLNTPKPKISTAFDYHFANLPDYLIEQRATAIEEEENYA